MAKKVRDCSKDIIIDLRNNSEPITANYAVSTDPDSIFIFLRKEDAVYNIKFGEIPHKKQLHIYGSNNVVILSESQIDFDEINIQASTVVLKEDTDVNSKLLKLQVDEARLYGSLTTNDCEAHINSEEYGLVNKGTLQVNNCYHQSNGTFLNKKDFNAARFSLQNGGYILNEKNARWHVFEAMNLAGRFFISRGNFYSAHLMMACQNIRIKGTFEGVNGQLKATHSLHFDESSICNFYNLLGASENDLLLAGQFLNSAFLQFASALVTIADSAVFQDCLGLHFSASQVLNSRRGANFIRIKEILAIGLNLSISSSFTFVEAVHLKGLVSLVIHPESHLIVPEIMLAGGDIFLYGKISGDVLFPEKIRSLYLDDKSVIENSKSLEVEALFITAYGRVQTEIMRFQVDISILTSHHTEILASIGKMISRFIEQSGFYSVRHMHHEAENLHLSPGIQIDGEMFEGLARSISLDGLILSNVSFYAECLQNKAFIVNKGISNFVAKIILANQERSTVNSGDVRLSSPQILQDGHITASNGIQETGDKIYNSHHSRLDATHTEIHGKGIILAGEVSGGNLSAKASDNITAFDTGIVQPENTHLHSSGTYSGSLNLNGKNAVIIGEKEADFLGGTMRPQESLSLASQDLHVIRSLVETNKVNLIACAQQDPSKNTRMKLDEQSTITAQSLYENFDDSEISAEIDLNTLILDSKRSANMTRKARIKFQYITVKTHACRIDAQIFQPPKITKAAEYDGGDEEELESLINPFKTEKSKALRLESDTELITFKNNSPPEEGILIDATDLQFGVDACFTTASDLNAHAEKISAASEFNMSAINFTAEQMEFTQGCAITRRTQKLNARGKFPLSTAEIKSGAIVDSQEASFENFDKVTVNGVLSSENIIAKVRQLHIDVLGHFGEMESKIFIHADHVKLEGILKAADAFIKSSRTFSQIGLGGPAHLKATKITLLTLLYLNVKGLTEAQQANYTSLLSVDGGISFINFWVENSLINLKALPNLPHFEFLKNFLSDIQNKKINLLDANYLQYAAQTVLAFLRLVFPRFAILASIGLSLYFITRQLKQLSAQVKNKNLKELQAVDLLSLAVILKNMGFSVFYAENGASSLYNGFDLKAFENLFTQFPGNIEQFFKDLTLGEVATTAEAMASVFMPAHYSDSLLNLSLLSPDLAFTHSTRDILGPSFLSPKIGANNSELDVVDLSVLDPRVNFFENETALINVSLVSPALSAECHKTGTDYLYNLSHDVVGNETLRGEHIKMAGVDAAHKVDVNAGSHGTVEQSAGTKITGTDVSIAGQNVLLADVDASNKAAIDVGDGTLAQIAGSTIKASDVHIKEDTARPHQLNYTDKIEIEYKTVDKKGNEEFRKTTDEKTKSENASAQRNNQKTNDNTKVSTKASRKNNRTAVKPENTPVDSEADLLKLEGEYSCYKPADPQKVTITFITDHKLTLPSMYLPWSSAYVAPELIVSAATEIDFAGRLHLVSTKNSVEIDGKLKGDTLAIDSADSIIEHGGSSETKNLWVTAQNNFTATEDLRTTGCVQVWQPSSNISDYGSITARNITEDASQLIFKRSGSLNAAGDVLAKCEFTPIWSNNAPDRIYRPALISGGNDAVGLSVHADGKIINDASIFRGQDGKLYLDGDQGVVGEEKDNPNCVYYNKHFGWGGEEEKAVYSLHIQRPVFQAINSDLFINSKNGTINSQCGVFQANNTTIHTQTAPIFGDLLVHTITDESSWFSSSHHVKSEFAGQIFLSPESLNIRTEQGDILIPNSTIQTAQFNTAAVNGKTILLQSPIQYDFYDSYFSLSANLGPFNVSYSADQDEPVKLWVSDPLKDAAIATAQSNRRNGEILGNLLGSADALAGKMNAYNRGNYAGIVDDSVGVKLGFTKRESHFQTPGQYFENFGSWNDNSRDGIKVVGIPVMVGEFNLLNGQKMEFDGTPLEISSQTTSSTLGVSYGLVTEKIDVSASLSEDNYQANLAAPAEIITGSLNVKKEGEGAEILLDNAQVSSAEVHGTIAKIVKQSECTDTKETVDSIGFATKTAETSTKELSISHDKITSHEVQESAFSAQDLSDCKIKEVDTVGDSKSSSTRHEEGFSAGYDLESKGPSSLGYTNTNGFDEHGVKLKLNRPDNLSQFISEAHAKNQPKSGCSDDFSGDGNDQGNNKEPENSDTDNININDRFSEEYIFDPNAPQTFDSTNHQKSSDNNSKKSTDDTTSIKDQFAQQFIFQDLAMANFGQNLQIQLFFPTSTNNFPPLPNINLPGSNSLSPSHNLLSSFFYSPSSQDKSENPAYPFLRGLSSRLDYPASDYLLAPGKGVQNALEGPASFLLDTIISYGNTFFPIPSEIYQASVERMGLRIEGFGSFLFNSANFLKNCAVVYVGSELQPLLYVSPSLSKTVIQANSEINQTLQTKIADPLNWMLFKATGPDLLKSVTEKTASFILFSAAGGKIAGLFKIDEFVYSGDSLSPSKIFKEGFKSEGNNLDLEKHVRGSAGENTADTGYIATSADIDIAKDFPPIIQPGIHLSWVFVIKKTADAINVDKQLMLMGSKLAGEYEEQEFAFPFEIPARNIKGAYTVLRKVPEEEVLNIENFLKKLIEDPTYEATTLVQESLPKRTLNLSKTFIENPGYNPAWTIEDYSQFLMGLGAYNIMHNSAGDLFLENSKNIQSPFPHHLMQAWNQVRDFCAAQTSSAGLISPDINFSRNQSSFWSRLNYPYQDYLEKIKSGAEKFAQNTWESLYELRILLRDEITVIFPNSITNLLPKNEYKSALVHHYMRKKMVAQFFQNSTLFIYNCIISYAGSETGAFLFFIPNFSERVDRANSQISHTLKVHIWSPMKNAADWLHTTATGPEVVEKITETGLGFILGGKEVKILEGMLIGEEIVTAVTASSAHSEKRIIISTERAIKLENFLNKKGIVPGPGTNKLAEFLVWQGFSPDASDKELRKIIKAQGWAGKGKDLVSLCFGILCHKFMNINPEMHETIIPKVFITDAPPQLPGTAKSSSKALPSPTLFPKEKTKEIPNISEAKENKK